MSKKKKNPSNRFPDSPLNDGVHFDDKLKAEKEAKALEKKAAENKKSHSESNENKAESDS